MRGALLGLHTELALHDNLDRTPVNLSHIRKTSHSTFSYYYPGAVRCTCRDNQIGGYFSDSADDKESNVQQATPWFPKKPKGTIIKRARSLLGSSLRDCAKEGAALVLRLGTFSIT